MKQLYKDTHEESIGLMNELVKTKLEVNELLQTSLKEHKLQLQVLNTLKSGKLLKMHFIHQQSLNNSLFLLY